MNFVLMDDVQQHNDILAAKLMKMCREKGWNGQIVLSTTQAEEVRRYAERCTQPTVFFMDIELDKKQTTLSLCQEISKNRENLIVYVSAHAQYAMECLHTHAFDFLLKPLTDAQLYDCLSAIMRIHEQKREDGSLQINMGSQTIMLPPAEILYFSRDGMNIQAHLEGENIYTWRESFDHLLPRLNEKVFVLCHRSFIVNLMQVHKIDWQKNEILMNDQFRVPISRRRTTPLKTALRMLEETK